MNKNKKRNKIKKKLNVNVSDYHPIKDCPFTSDQPLPFSFLANSLDLVGALSGKGSKEKQIIIMANVFRSVMLLCPE